MSKKIIYWTGVYSPSNEGVSKEIYILHKHFKRSFVYGISSKNFLKFSIKNRYLVHFYRPYRFTPKLIPLLEKKFDISHIYHNLDYLFFLDNVRKKPIILTAAAGGEILDIKKYEKIDKIIVESEFDKKRLINAGINKNRIKLIYPGIELDKFSCKKAAGDFKILFASSPFEKKYFAARGINMLLSCSKNLSGIAKFILLWRRWAGTIKPIKSMLKDKSNIKLYLKNIKDINLLLSKVHAVIAPFTTHQLNKPCPHSIIESLAAGKPVLVSDKVGIANIIKKERCGVIFKPNKESLIKAVHELKKNYNKYQKNARKCAEKYFSKEKFIKEYVQIYKEFF